MTQIGLIAKHAALWPMIFGGILGGILMLKIGISDALWLFGLVQIVSILGFAVLAKIGEGAWLLGLVISFEYLGVGLGTAAFVAFIARSTHPAFAATVALFLRTDCCAANPGQLGNRNYCRGIGWGELFLPLPRWRCPVCYCCLGWHPGTAGAAIMVIRKNLPLNLS